MKLVWGFAGNSGLDPKGTRDLNLNRQDIPLLARLFNLTADPLETNNIADLHPELVLSMMERIAEIEVTAVPADDPDDAEAGNPNNFGGFWSPGWC